jgi:hypothetical protein
MEKPEQNIPGKNGLNRIFFKKRPGLTPGLGSK